MTTQSALCPDSDLSALLESASANANDGLLKAEQLLHSYAEDPRLFFLRGSLLAQLDRHVEARSALREALQIAPNYAIARFQLGLMELTGGDAPAAFSVWGPLAILKEDHYLSQFVRGLQHMVRDEFETAIALLQAGIERNSELPPLNKDMNMLIDEMRVRLFALQADGASSSAATPTATSEEPTSMTQFLLNQFRNKKNLH